MRAAMRAMEHLHDIAIDPGSQSLTPVDLEVVFDGIGLDRG